MKKVIIMSIWMTTITLLALSTGVNRANADEMVSYIVRFNKNISANVFVKRSFGPDVQIEPLVEDLNLYKVTVRKSRADFLRVARSFSGVTYAQEDHPVQMRNTLPNDSDFDDQWNLMDGVGGINAVKAWDFGTSGLDVSGHQPVVAVVDGGVDINHPDLKNNIWVNLDEVPNNQIDDEGNGYIDDVYGWNALTDSGIVGSSKHGTHVAGIVSASGNNGLHVSGVNWNVKVMAINGSSGTTSIVLKAYGYVLKQRKLFNESNGQKGAYVVATNSSFGVDRADCKSSNYAAWNDIYEEMGKVGILSAAATANAGWDIDAVGDVPTGCSSKYIVKVTNTTKDDVKYSSAGYGATKVDIGAPGTDIVSTVPGNSTARLTGTSMATPHVAGAIGFLYTVASQELERLAEWSPAAGALEMKRILMEGVDLLPSLQGKTVSGGRLNLYNSANLARYYSGYTEPNPGYTEPAPGDDQTPPTTPGDDDDDDDSWWWPWW